MALLIDPIIIILLVVITQSGHIPILFMERKRKQRMLIFTSERRPSMVIFLITMT